MSILQYNCGTNYTGLRAQSLIEWPYLRCQLQSWELLTLLFHWLILLCFISSIIILFYYVLRCCGIWNVTPRTDTGNYWPSTMNQAPLGASQKCLISPTLSNWEPVRLNHIIGTHSSKWQICFFPGLTDCKAIFVHCYARHCPCSKGT